MKSKKRPEGDRLKAELRTPSLPVKLGVRSSAFRRSPSELHAKAVALLAARDYTTAQLRAKLAQQFDADSSEVLDALTRQGALDDRRFAENYQRRRPSMGPVRLRAELLRRGVDAATIDAVLEAGGKEHLSLSEVLNATMSDLGLHLPLTPRDAGRVFRALQRLGYAAEDIQEEFEGLL